MYKWLLLLFIIIISSISTATDGHKLYLHAYMDKNIFFIIKWRLLFSCDSILLER